MPVNGSQSLSVWKLSPMSNTGSVEVVRDESEASLIARAQFAVSNCNWEVGECAALWTKRFSRGRTDADFAALVSLSADQIYQRRRVWEAFADVHKNYTSLKWSHFYAALNWDDAAECLQWAEDVQAGVAEMKAWRRAQRGEDLDTSAEELVTEGLSLEPALAREATPFEHGTSFSFSANDQQDEEAETEVGLTTRPTPAEMEYAPYKADATTPYHENTERPVLSAEQIAKRLTTTIERCHSLVTADFIREFAELPEKVQKRFLKATEQLAEKVAELG